MDATPAPGSPSGPTRARAAAEAALLALAVACAALAALLLATPSSRSAAPAQPTGSASQAGLRWSLHGAPAPGFSLRDQDGRTTTLADLRGRTVMLTFLDSRCTNLCPIEGAQLAAVQRHLKPASPAELVVISVNPADTEATVRRFVREAGWTGPWRWLLGSHAALAPVWREYHIGVQISHGRAVQTQNTTIRVGGGVAHTIALYLIDAHGREQTGYLPPFRPATVAGDVRALQRS